MLDKYLPFILGHLTPKQGMFLCYTDISANFQRYPLLQICLYFTEICTKSRICRKLYLYLRYLETRQKFGVKTLKRMWFNFIILEIPYIKYSCNEIELWL